MKVLITLTICLSMIFYASVSLSNSESDEICCTWVNTNYEAGKSPQKIMFHYDGTFATYDSKDSWTASSRGMFRIEKKWTDDDGNLWYKIMMNDLVYGKKYNLARVMQDGKSLEFVCNPDKYPAEIKTDASGYCKYIRASINYEAHP